MPLPKFSVQVLPRLTETGSTFMLRGSIDAPSYEMGNERYTLATGVDYDAVFTNTGGAILITGMAHVTVLGQCSRCLEPATFEISSEIEGYYLLSGTSLVSNNADCGADEFDVLETDGTVDLSLPITAGLIIETPSIPLCREDCRGLCPVCGANLNEGDCKHVKRGSVARQSATAGSGGGGETLSEESDNPFVVLRNLHLFDETDADLDTDKGDGHTAVADLEH
jgi:uncharacterized protein